jgi:UDP-glucose 4-epimerase
MADTMRILITGATGKVGQAFIPRFLADPRFDTFQVRALCHSRVLPPHPRMEIMRGSMQTRSVIADAVKGVSHILHLATTKENPDTIMDIAVRGLFWLLEESRANLDFRQFVLIGGDASVGHCTYLHPIPVTEAQRHSAYPGCYALSKVLEEVMLEQYYRQYDLNGCCLRASWIMEKDDLKYHLSFGEDVFGGPRWRELVAPETAAACERTRTVPIMLDREGRPIRRNFVHVNDLVSAILQAIDNRNARQQTFNISMDEPVDYGELGTYLSESRGLPTIGITTPYHSTWLDTSKAKFLLGWRPRYDLRKLADEAWEYQREPTDPRIVWYPG